MYPNQCKITQLKKEYRLILMKKTILQCIIMLICICATYGQVTIGSLIEPREGVLLDLKENSSIQNNSNKGLMLPRVNIVNLQPTSNTGSYGLSASIGSPQTESWDLAAHIGLTVYNLNPCPVGKSLIYDEVGVQIWDGKKWYSVMPHPKIIDATPAETSGADIWGGSVVRHAAKPNPSDPTKYTYLEFYSADFGSAGRWMTTNLVAWAYDSNVTGVTLPELPSKVLEFTPSWAYPETPTDPATLKSNPFLGILYNWYAANANKALINNEGGRPYGTSTLYGSTLTVTRNQGICPNGWHLPSDYEWTELENEITRNTIRYANVVDNIYTNDSDILPQDNIHPALSVEWERGSTQGQAVKAPCIINGTNPGGKSKSIAEGGFNFLLPGAITDLARGNYLGIIGFCWTSSPGHSGGLGWYRSVGDSTLNTIRKTGGRTVYKFSVRCKKD